MYSLTLPAQNILFVKRQNDCLIPEFINNVSKNLKRGYFELPLKKYLNIRDTDCKIKI